MAQDAGAILVDGLRYTQQHRQPLLFDNSTGRLHHAAVERRAQHRRLLQLQGAAPVLQRRPRILSQHAPALRLHRLHRTL